MGKIRAMPRKKLTPETLRANPLLRALIRDRALETRKNKANSSPA